MDNFNKHEFLKELKLEALENIKGGVQSSDDSSDCTTFEPKPLEKLSGRPAR